MNYNNVFDYSEKIFLEYLKEQNKEEISRLEEDAMNTKSASSFYFLAYILFYAIGVERNVIRSKTYLEEAVKYSEGVAQCDTRHYRAHELLAWIYESGQSGCQSFERAYSLYQAGKKGDSPSFSLERLGFLHYWGYGCEQNYRVAAEYFIEAAENDSAFAHYSLGTMYRDGVGVSQEVEKAMSHFEKAAEKGHEDAISCLAYMYSEEFDEWINDSEKSMYYYEKLTQMNSIRAQRMGWYGIGYAYLNSESVEERKYAINSLKKASELGSEQAKELLKML